MKTKTALVARQCRLQEWANQIRDCKNRSSNLTVEQWCEQNNISPANYYYRLKQVREACLESMPMKQSLQSVVPVPVNLIKPTKSHVANIELIINNISIRVTQDTSEELLKMVVKVISDVK